MRRAVGRVALEDLAGEEPVAPSQPVPLPELEGIHAELLGQQVHLRLDGERDLRRPRTAHASGRRVVREGHPAVELDVRPAVRTRRRGERLDHEPRAERGVRTGVGEHVDLEGGEVAIARGTASTPDPVGVPLRRGGEGLGPAVDDPDRPARPIRGQGSQALARDLRLPAERATDDRGDDPDALDRQAQRPRDLGPVVVGVLRRGPHDERLALPGGQRRFGLQVGVLVPRGRVGLLHHDIGAGEPFRDVARPQPVLGHQVAVGVDLRCAVRERVIGSEHGGEQAVLHLDHREGRGRLFRRGRHDEGDGIAHLANPGVRQDRLVLHLAAVAVLPGDVPGGQDCLDARHPARALRVDAHDLGVGVGAPQHPGMQHPLDREVRRVEGAARGLVQRVRAPVPGSLRGQRRTTVLRSRGPPARRALLPVGDPLDRVHDALVARAAAEVAAEPANDLAPAGPGVALEQRRRGHDHPGGAEPALDGVGRGKRLLQGVRTLGAPEPLDRQDVASGRLARGRPARADRLPVDHDDAGPARAVIAAFLGPDEAKAVAQQVQQPPPRRDVEAARDAVHHQGHAHRLGHAAIPAVVRVDLPLRRALRRSSGVGIPLCTACPASRLSLTSPCPQNQPPRPSNDGCAGCRLSRRVDTISTGRSASASGEGPCGGVARATLPLTGRLEMIDEHERDDRAAGDHVRQGGGRGCDRRGPA